jgi:hypothetical protein
MNADKWKSEMDKAVIEAINDLENEGSKELEL